jgi:hypothetical protein
MTKKEQQEFAMNESNTPRPKYVALRFGYEPLFMDDEIDPNAIGAGSDVYELRHIGHTVSVPKGGEPLPFEVGQTLQRTNSDDRASYFVEWYDGKDFILCSRKDQYGSQVSLYHLSAFKKNTAPATSTVEFVRTGGDADVLVRALEQIFDIEDKMQGGDWEEITEARDIAVNALAAYRKQTQGDGK